MAVGAALGASMPSTRQEDEWLGTYRDRLRDEAAEYGREQMHRVADAAEQAMSGGQDSPKDERRAGSGEARTGGAGSPGTPSGAVSGGSPGV